MKRITLDAPAKINLYLDVTSKRNDGYHNIESVMQSVTLVDTVTVTLGEKTGQHITQHFENSSLPCDETNICFKAARAYLDRFGINDYDIDISVIKNIPEAAGLAGGSTDGAAVLRALDILYENNTSTETLCEIGLTVGSDIAFCIVGSTAAVTGRGEYVKKLAPLSDTGLYLVIAKSQKESVSTREAYRRIDADSISARGSVSFDEYVKAVENKDIKTLTEGVYNIFERVMSDSLTDTYKIISIMKDAGALASMMSGSGPSVFGIFESREAAEKACHILENDYFATVCELG
ncbi:MAG: 4-(cytidine 5'-diphospho)-2-C-methyl-D-erythritol kinase [Clostridia bacterium]|nr:4-(cytidine 5'-diphospho)-2-C-methyl-D-erythritol kinase [Clostridia bacterium]